MFSAFLSHNSHYYKVHRLVPLVDYIALNKKHLLTYHDRSMPELPDVASELLPWWDGGHSLWPWRESRDPYAIWVAEVMLQQTQIATVLPYYRRWMDRFPSVQTLAVASLDDVLKFWEGLGYYSRARS